MSLANIKKVNRGLCQDFCDLAGKSGNLQKAWIYAILLDVVIPICLFLVGITISIGAFLLELLIPYIGGTVVGVVAIVVFLIAIGAIILVMFLLFREIGIFVIIPIGMDAVAIVLSVIPILNIIAFFMFLIPWSIISVVAHALLEPTEEKRSALVIA